MILTWFSSLFTDLLFTGFAKVLVASPIPYKASKMPVEQYGFNEAIVLTVFLGLAIVVYFYLKKKNIDQFSLIKDRKVKVVERTRVTARSSILLIQYNNRSFLMSQSADAISLITEVETKEAT